MKTLFISLIAAAMLVSCGNSDEIAINDFTISFDNQPGIKVTKDGSIAVQSQMIGTIDKGGQVRNTKGVVIANYKDGMLNTANNDLNLKIDKDGTTYMGSDTLMWKDGQLMKDHAPSGFTISPADAKNYRCASIVLVLQQTIGSTTVTEVPDTTKSMVDTATKR